MKLLIKNIFKKIKKSIGRFLSITLIIALGISVFIGLRESTAGMLYTADNYYDENNLMDFKHLALLLGVSINVAIKNKCNYTTINILEWKSYYNMEKLGNRDLGKTLSKKIVLENLGIDVIDDVSDSILIGYYLFNKNIVDSYDW